MLFLGYYKVLCAIVVMKIVWECYDIWLISLCASFPKQDVSA